MGVFAARGSPGDRPGREVRQQTLDLIALLGLARVRGSYYLFLEDDFRCDAKAEGPGSMDNPPRPCCSAPLHCRCRPAFQVHRLRPTGLTRTTQYEFNNTVMRA